jgi:hypothetical protein
VIKSRILRWAGHAVRGKKVEMLSKFEQANLKEIIIS